MKGIAHIKMRLSLLEKNIYHKIWRGSLDEMAGEAWSIHRSLVTNGQDLEPLATRFAKVHSTLTQSVEVIDELLDDIEAAIAEKDSARFFERLKEMRNQST